MAEFSLSRENRAKVVQQLLKDRSLCERFLADPKGTLSSELKTELPAALNIHVVRSDAETMNIVIPQRPPGLADDFDPSFPDTMDKILADPTLSDERKIHYRVRLVLVGKAWKDDAYRRALVDDPVRCVEEEFGVKVPANVTVQVFEEDAEHLYIDLPMTIAIPMVVGLDDAVVMAAVVTAGGAIVAAAITGAASIIVALIEAASKKQVA